MQDFPYSCFVAKVVVLFKALFGLISLLGLVSIVGSFSRSALGCPLGAFVLNLFALTLLIIVGVFSTRLWQERKILLTWVSIALVLFLVVPFVEKATGAATPFQSLITKSSYWILEFVDLTQYCPLGLSQSTFDTAVAIIHIPVFLLFCMTIHSLRLRFNKLTLHER